MTFDTESLRAQAEEDYEKAWVESARLLKFKGRNFKWKKERGKPHPVVEVADRFRKTLLALGFEEVVNPSIISDEEVRKQYGPEAPLILDRCFYLAGLPRVDIGISKETEARIREIARIDIEALKRIFREYKESKIEADDLVEEMVKRLNIKTEQATAILSLFSELKELKPVPMKLVLRSHMTSAWFLTIAALIRKRLLPLKLFSIGSRFRREQQQDALHLYESTTASLVVVARELSLEDGMELTRKILTSLGFESVELREKRATSKYYAPRTEFEVFVKYKGKHIEIGDGGLYSPVSLANYDIPYPVFNVGFGVERIAMLLENVSDIRTLVYPQFYAPASFTDEEIARALKFKEAPQTVAGKRLASKILSAILEHKDEVGPKRFFAGKLGRFAVYVSEPEANKKLLGPAGLNEVYVYEGNVLGINPRDERFKEVVKRGIRVCSYLEAISNLFAALAEKGRTGRHTVKIADTLPSINLELEDAVKKFITANRKRIDVRGPVFIDVEIEEG